MVILVFCLIPKRYKIINLYFFILIGIILISVSAFRSPGLDRDYENYVVIFKGIRANLSVEYTFTVIQKLITWCFNGDVIYLFLFYAILGVISKFRSILILTPFIFYSVLVYISNFYMLHEMTQIRVGVASGFLLISIKYIVDRNLKKFLLYSALAISFHYSAIIILPLWFLTNKFQKIFYYIIPLGILIYLLNINIIVSIPIPYIQERILIYQKFLIGNKDIDQINVFNYLFILRCFVYYMFVFLRKKILIKNNYFIVILKIYGLSLFAFPAFASVFVFSFRINEFYGAVEIILIPFMIYFRKDVGVIFTILFSLIVLYYNLYVAELIL